MFAITKNDVPSGIIAVWRKAIVDIPAGWHLCDGTNGTEDLRGSFIIGAGLFFNVDDTGGGNDHIHTFTGNPHNHSIADGGMILEGDTFSDQTLPATPTGSIDRVSHMPPYRSKAYIQKL